MRHNTIEEIKNTPMWDLYQRCVDYHRLIGTYVDTDKNYRFYNGDQWEGAKLGDVEPVQKNIIKPIVKYKNAVIHDNLYAIVFASQNHESREYAKEAEGLCEILNAYAARVWEQQKLDFKGRRLTTDACVNSEGIYYVDFDKKTNMPVVELLDKTDVYYGNENSDDVQSQPYIIVKRRMDVYSATELAKTLGAGKAVLDKIVGDKDYLEEAGEAAKRELEDQCTVLYKFYRLDGTVHYSVSTRYADIIKDVDLELSLYPICHMVWEECKGSARGVSEVKHLIPNQIEINRIEVRRCLAVKSQAFPKMVADVSKIDNPSDLDRAGAIIEVNGATVDDVNKIVGTLKPAQMSQDVKLLQDDLISLTRELAGAGDVATGDINPEQASGRAILAVKASSEAPITAQKEAYKNTVEDLARIILDYLIVHSDGGIDLEKTVIDPASGEEYVVPVTITREMLKKLRAVVKIDVTPKSVFNIAVQEQVMENLLTGGYLTPQRAPELKIFAELLPDEANAPKQKILDAVAKIEENQRKIEQINARAQIARARVNQLMMSDPQMQRMMLNTARAKAAAAGSPVGASMPTQT